MPEEIRSSLSEFYTQTLSPDFWISGEYNKNKISGYLKNYLKRLQYFGIYLSEEILWIEDFESAVVAHQASMRSSTFSEVRTLSLKSLNDTAKLHGREKALRAVLSDLKARILKNPQFFFSQSDLESAAEDISIAAAWKVVEDVQLEPSPFEPYTEIWHQGAWPIGPLAGKFVIYFPSPEEREKRRQKALSTPPNLEPPESPAVQPQSEEKEENVSSQVKINISSGGEVRQTVDFSSIQDELPSEIREAISSAQASQVSGAAESSPSVPPSQGEGESVPSPSSQAQLSRQTPPAAEESTPSPAEQKLSIAAGLADSPGSTLEIPEQDIQKQIAELQQSEQVSPNSPQQLGTQTSAAPSEGAPFAPPQTSVAPPQTSVPAHTLANESPVPTSSPPYEGTDSDLPVQPHSSAPLPPTGTPTPPPGENGLASSPSAVNSGRPQSVSQPVPAHAPLPTDGQMPNFHPQHQLSQMGGAPLGEPASESIPQPQPAVPHQPTGQVMAAPLHSTIPPNQPIESLPHTPPPQNQLSPGDPLLEEAQFSKKKKGGTGLIFAVFALIIAGVGGWFFYNQSAGVLYKKAIEMLRAKNYTEAEHLLLRVLEKDKNYPKLYVALGDIYWHTGRKNKALEAYRKAFMKNSSHASAARNLAFLLLQRGNFSEAKEVLEKIAELEPKDPYIYAFLGSIMIREEKFERAQQLLSQAIELQQNRPEFWNDRGVAYLKWAISSNDQELLDSPYSPIELAKKAEVSFRKALNYEGDSEKKPTYYTHLGNSLILQGALDDALLAYDSALRISPSYAPALQNKAALLIYRENYTEALQLLLKAEQLLKREFLKNTSSQEAQFNYTTVLNNLAFTYQKLKKNRKALEYYLKAVKISFDNKFAVCNSAKLLFSFRKKRRALKLIKRCIALKPDDLKYFQRLLIRASR